MGILGTGKGGPRSADDGAYSQWRVGAESHTLRVAARARYTEMAQRGQVWSANSSQTGVTLTAASTAGAALTTPLLGILNPLGSGISIEIITGVVGHMSGVPAAGIWAWCMAKQDASITVANNITPRSHLTGSVAGSRVSKAQLFSVVALTGQRRLFDIVRPFPCAMFASGMSATRFGMIDVDDVVGDLIVNPGYMAAYAPAAAGSAHVVACGLTWAEVPFAWSPM